VLDMLVQHRRDSRAALRLMRKLFKKQGSTPKLLVTDKLRSYASKSPAAYDRARGSVSSEGVVLQCTPARAAEMSASLAPPSMKMRFRNAGFLSFGSICSTGAQDLDHLGVTSSDGEG
jgi:hypothetical protein